MTLPSPRPHRRLDDNVKLICVALSNLILLAGTWGLTHAYPDSIGPVWNLFRNSEIGLILVCLLVANRGPISSAPRQMIASEVGSSIGAQRKQLIGPNETAALLWIVVIWNLGNLFLLVQGTGGFSESPFTSVVVTMLLLGLFLTKGTISRVLVGLFGAFYFSFAFVLEKHAYSPPEPPHSWIWLAVLLVNLFVAVAINLVTRPPRF
jgi:hypothetical protein